jgi:CheY-like chemotaxis protein
MARLLVIEDNVDVRETLAAVCETWGHQVATASDGREALSLVTAFRPDVVLLDMMLAGELDGPEVARRIRAADGWGTFIVALSAWAVAADRARALIGGANVFFTKPIDLDVLQRTISRAVAKRLRRRRS